MNYLSQLFGGQDMRLFARHIRKNDTSCGILTVIAAGIARMREYFPDHIPDVGNCLGGVATLQGRINDPLNMVGLDIAEAVRI
jgi:hypothetical protein